MALIIAILIVAAIVPFAFHGTNGGALIADIILVVIIAAALSSC
jgi:hypothetical protein